jgi:hypothetical protein
MASGKDILAGAVAAMRLEGESVDILGVGSAAFGSGGDTSLSGTGTTVQGMTVDIVGATIDIQSPSGVSPPKSAGLSAPTALAVDNVPRDTGVTDLTDVAGDVSKGLATGSMSGVYRSVTDAIATGQTQLASNMSVTPLMGAMQGLETNLNNASGAVANLPADQIKTIQSQSAALVETAAKNGFTIKLVPSMLPPIPNTSPVMGKQLYPVTQSVVPGISSRNNI